MLKLGLGSMSQLAHRCSLHKGTVQGYAMPMSPSMPKPKFKGPQQNCGRVAICDMSTAATGAHSVWREIYISKTSKACWPFLKPSFESLYRPTRLLL